MNPIRPALGLQSAEIAALTARWGRPVDVATLGVLDRAGHLPLDRPGLTSPNRACRLFRVADGWMVANLAREEDRDLIPAWLDCEFGLEPWRAIASHAPRQTTASLVAGADLLGLPAGAVGEVTYSSLDALQIRLGAGAARAGPLKVVDLSALWAGPLCGAILAAMGAEVTKVESLDRPDPTRSSTPRFFENLNGAKRHRSLDLRARDDQVRLRDLIQACDVLITSARPRAFPGLGLIPADLFAANPGLVWVAVTGYGWTGAGASRVAFGDDAAAAGGVVRWTAGGAPRFLGDALADPVTGLAAALGALKGLQDGGGVLVDVSLARSAAGAAHVCGLAPAP